MLAALLAAAPVAAAGPAGRVLAAPPAIGPADAIVTVNSTGDAADLIPGDGSCDTGSTNTEAAAECTVRAAIAEANAHPADMAITFGIPTSDPGHNAGVWTIQPASRFESLTDPATIDGTTQSGYVATPVVHIDGSALTVDLANSGFVIDTSAAGSVVRGLSISGFGNDALQTQANGVVIEDNYVGVLPDGVTAVGSASEGVIVHGTAAGTIIRDNLFGGHPNAAIALNGDTTGSVVQGNRFGTDATGTVSMPNGQSVWSDTTGTALIGGTGAGEGNLMANSGWNAIEIHGATARIAILGNEIVDSGHLAVDLGSDNVVTPNDPGDSDVGTNDLLNFPVLDAAVAAAGSVEIDFTLDVPVGDYRVEFFANPSGLDPTGHGEAEQLVGFTELGHLGGSRSYTATVTGAPGDELTATATRLAPGPVPDVTSELAAGITVVPATVVTVNSAGDAGDLVPGDTVCDTGGTNSGGAPECTLRAALEEADAAAGPTVVEFAMPVTEPGYQPAPVAYAIAPASPLPLVGQRVVIDATTQSEHASAGRPVVQVDGTSAGPATGLRLSGPGSVLRGLSIGNFDGAGLVVSGTGTVVAGNHIGVDPVGTTETPNNGLGVDVNADAAIVGGTAAADRNVISGNGNTAVSVVGVVDVTVTGNHLGTDVTGLVAMTNGGIYAVSASGDRIQIGGIEPGAGNVIGGYWGGIGLSSGTGSVVEGNLIGVGADGTTPVPNVRGISMGGTGHRIGGPDAAMRNVIANSTQEGISIDSGSGGLVQGNYVGTDGSGVTPAPNDNGIRVVGGADHLVGGSGPGEGNLIASNNQRGLLVTGGTGTRIQGNDIRGNGWQGIYASSGAADQVTIGGTGAGEGNTITQSGNIGVVLQVGTYGGITVVGNSIHDNGSIGIDHNWDGVTANDVGDLDDGPNGLLNHPVLTSALEVADTVSLDLDLDVPAGDYRLEVFTNPGGTDPSGHGEGEVLAHATTITHAGLGVETFSTSFAGSAGDVLTATVTEESAGPAFGSTSEFSSILTVAAPIAVTVNDTRDAGDLLPGDQICDTGGLNATGAPACTLRAAIEETNASGMIDRIEFALPAADPGLTAGVWTIAPTSPLPAVSSSVAIDGSTQPGHLPNTAAALAGSTATMAVELSGSAAGPTDGLVLNGVASTVRGLVVNGFDGHGVVLAGAGSSARGVYVGVTPNGGVAAANKGDGVVLNGDATELGGTDPADRSVVSGNGGQGVRVRGDNVLVRGAHIGVGANTMWSLRNGGNGIRLDDAAYTVIGQPGAGNIIAGNDNAASTADGIFVVLGGGHTIQANLIGTNLLGSGLGNYSAGLALDDTKATLIGGTGPGEGNTIRFNGSSGIAIRGGSEHVAVLFNTMTDNGGLGIDHAQDGVTANDAGDLDTGPNGLLNHP
ncbi:MAG: right-handed parallel beta-helix repeat-containing protein, partial [Acidimicrobiia bacterium]|nr:right-handed parallel beta-helix repeat-containing protein [Acidimicrobiia bacterium]